MAKAVRKTAKQVPELDKAEVARLSVEDPASLASLVALLSQEDRQERIRAAGAVHEVALIAPAVLKPHVAQLVDALERPEPQTRWEVLGALEVLVAFDPRGVEKAVASASLALHDASSGVVRAAGFRMLASLGATTPTRSAKVWPLLDEALRCYHGDPEYPAMLGGLVLFCEGAASPEIKRAAATVVEADTNHPRSLVRRRAQRVALLAQRASK